MLPTEKYCSSEITFVFPKHTEGKKEQEEEKTEK